MKRYRVVMAYKAIDVAVVEAATKALAIELAEDAIATPMEDPRVIRTWSEVERHYQPLVFIEPKWKE